MHHLPWASERWRERSKETKSGKGSGNAEREQQCYPEGENANEEKSWQRGRHCETSMCCKDSVAGEGENRLEGTRRPILLITPWSGWKRWQLWMEIILKLPPLHFYLPWRMGVHWDKMSLWKQSNCLGMICVGFVLNTITQTDYCYWDRARYSQPCYTRIGHSLRVWWFTKFTAWCDVLRWCHDLIRFQYSRRKAIFVGLEWNNWHIWAVSQQLHTTKQNFTLLQQLQDMVTQTRAIIALNCYDFCIKCMMKCLIYHMYTVLAWTRLSGIP